MTAPSPLPCAQHKQRQGLHTLAPAVGSNASFMDPGASIGLRLWLQSQ